MKEIPSNFLQEIAKDCELTEKQTEAFVAFYKSERSKQEVARELKISKVALSSRLISICKKIIERGNESVINELRNIIWKKYYLIEKKNIYFFYIPKSKKIAKKAKNIVLNLSRNQLIELPYYISNLTNLSQLDLSWNKLVELSESIGNLTNLSQLDLSVNELIELPESIGNLTNLSQLDLSVNELIELPESIGNLTNLSQLDLSVNELIELPESIGNLTNLSELNLRGNRLTKLPETISSLTNLFKIDLRGNPLENPPLEIANQGIDAIREYFRQLEDVGEDYIYEAKLLIVGEAGAGKTTLANKIQNTDYQLPEESGSTSTEGIDVVKWKFKIDNEREFCINIWDFGGQEIYHATHQFFLTKRSLYTLVADSRKEDTDFYYWLNVVELLSENSPLLIVKNEKADRKRDINEKTLRGQFNNLKETLSSNLKINRGLDTIVNNIKHYIQHLPHIGQALPKTWIKVRQALENNSRNYITLNKYLDICQENGFSLHKDKLQLSSYLHDLGVCLHFQDKEDSLLYKTIILKPEWGTQAVYTVLDNEQVKNNRGCFTRDDLKIIWEDEEYVEMRGELLELMKKFQLCYEIPSQKNTFIAPQLLGENKLDYEWNDNYNLTLRYSYPDFMPKGIITRFIVAMHQHIDTENDVSYVWKTGVILNKNKTKAEVIEYYGRRIIEIRVYGTDKRDLMTIVTHEIDKINDSFKKPKHQKLIPCNCQVCKGSKKQHFYSFLTLKNFVNDRQQNIQCPISYEMVNVLNLIDDVIIWEKPKDIDVIQKTNNLLQIHQERMKTRMNKTINKEIYISYSWSKESKAIVDLIDENFKNRGIEIHRDIKNVNYKDSIKEFMQRLGKGKCIIIIISQKYLESPNCMFELIKIAENNDFKERIFPIIMKDANIFNPVHRIRYITYWQNKSKELNQAIKEIEDQSYLQGFREDLDLYVKIRNTIAGLTDILRDMNALTPDIHLKSEFQELFQSIENKLQD